MKVSERLRANPRSRGYNRNKGHNFERACANDLKRAFPKVRRQLEYHSSDCKGVDLMHTGPYRFQCKNTKRLVPLNTIKEVQCDQAIGEIPVLVATAEGEEPLAVLPWWALVALIEATEVKRG